MIYSLSSGDMYLFFSSSISLLASSFYERAILLPIKSPVASAVFLIAVLEEVFIAPVVHF